MTGRNRRWPKSLQSGHAFGHPGLPPTWQTARKLGVGTAYSERSRVWFTLARGILTEVYYPRVDVVNVRDLQFLISDGCTFVHEEQRDLRHEIVWPEDGVPAYRLINSDPEGQYRLIKNVVTDPEADALIMRVAFEVLRSQAEDYALYLLLNPQVKNQGWHNFARVIEVDGQTVLLAWREDVALALVTSAPVAKASCGFVGFSDGWQDLHANLQMDWTFDATDDGNVALMAALPPFLSGGAGVRGSQGAEEQRSTGASVGARVSDRHFQAGPRAAFHLLLAPGSPVGGTGLCNQRGLSRKEPTMRVLLVQPGQGQRMGFRHLALVEPLGLEMIAGRLLDEHEVAILDLRVTPGQLESTLADFNPDLCGISSTFTIDLYRTLEIAETPKAANPRTFVIVGGHHASLNPAAFHHPAIDAVALGGGETIAKELARCLQAGDDPARVPGLIINQPQGQTCTGHLPLSRSLDHLPYPARELTKPHRHRYYLLTSRPIATVESSRGCPYRCNFCSVWRFYQGRTGYKSPERVVSELEAVEEQDVLFVDDNFLLSP